MKFLVVSVIALTCAVSAPAFAQTTSTSSSSAQSQAAQIQANRTQTVDTIRQTTLQKIQALFTPGTRPTPAERQAAMALRQSAQTQIAAANQTARAAFQALRAEMRAAHTQGAKP